MRALSDYMFVKLYQWFEYLNRINRRYGIAWEEDSLWSAIFGLSVLQSIQTFSIGMALSYLLGCDEYILLAKSYLPENVKEIVFLLIWVTPLVIFYYFNKKRYIDKNDYKKIVSKIRKNKVSNVWAVLYFIATWLIFILLVLYRL